MDPHLPGQLPARLYLVSGRRGLRHGWPLAVVGSLAYILGQFPTSQYLGPYLPDVFGSLVSIIALLVLLKFWHPADTLGYGGVPVSEALPAPVAGSAQLSLRDVLVALSPFLILIVVVVLWTGPWSPLPKFTPFKASATAVSSLSGKPVSVLFAWAPAIAGTAILASWLVILAFLRPRAAQLGEVFRRTFHQMWGSILVGAFVFGLAFVFNYAGLANSLAYGFSRIGCSTWCCPAR